MINSLDEAIKHCEEVAEKKEKECKWISGSEDAGMNGALAKTYAECAKEHRQLAEWLKELKGLRDFANFVAESVMEEDFEEDGGVYAEIFCRKLYKMGFIEAEDGKWIFNKEEVNADGDSN